MKRFLKVLPLWVLVLAIGLISCNDDDNNIKVNFTSLAANGSATETTTILTLKFDTDLALTVADIIITDTDDTGAEKGELSELSDGVYELEVSGIAAEGTINVGITKKGYEINPASKDVTVYAVEPLNLNDFVGTMSFDDVFYWEDVYDVTSSKVSDTELLITGVFEEDVTMKIVVDLYAHTVTIPKQVLFPSIWGYTNFAIEGSGTIDGVAKIINFTATCTVDQGGWDPYDYVLTLKPNTPSK